MDCFISPLIPQRVSGLDQQQYTNSGWMIGNTIVPFLRPLYRPDKIHPILIPINPESSSFQSIKSQKKRIFITLPQQNPYPLRLELNEK